MQESPPSEKDEIEPYEETKDIVSVEYIDHRKSSKGNWRISLLVSNLSKYRVVSENMNMKIINPVASAGEMQIQSAQIPPSKSVSVTFYIQEIGKFKFRLYDSKH